MKSFSVLLDKPWEEQMDLSVLDWISLDTNDLTQIIFTSGTTGEPKGVMHTHNTLCIAAESWCNRLNLTSDDVVFMASTFAHQTGFVYGVRVPVHIGDTGVYQDVWNPEEFLRLTVKEKITVTTAATPFLYDVLQTESLENHDLSSLRVFAAIGAPIPRGLVREAAGKMPCSILAGWGQTENGLVTLTLQMIQKKN
ncbi:AMP-binding protein [Thermoactinomyces mirandus]|uniref:AMP-binding protein n=1 Tax=Thermoactinomyces mirandus TaxID=2756294 RepID=UPI001C689120|nr:AMP-binding protein [Thermoactinomyces mirandus]